MHRHIERRNYDVRRTEQTPACPILQLAGERNTVVPINSYQHDISYGRADAHLEYVRSLDPDIRDNSDEDVDSRSDSECRDQRPLMR